MLDNVDDKKAHSQEEAHCKRLLKRIKSFESKLDDRAKSWDEAFKHVDGKPNDDGDEGLVRTNVIGSKLEAIQPTIYAKAPEIAVSIDDHVDTSDYPLIDKFAKTLESALNVFLVKDAKLKIRGKSAVRYSLVSTLGIAKVIYQIDRKDDPSIVNRINDTQDNIERINRLLEETKEQGGQCDDYEAQLYTLNQTVESLHKQIEVVIAEGLVVDIINPKDIIVLDSAYVDIDGFVQAPEIAHRIKISVGEFKNRFKKNPPNGAKTYIEGDNEKQVAEDDKLICIYEVWSLNDLTVYTLCEGSPSYIKEPQQPIALGEQWYPFFPLQLRRLSGVKYPLSMVEQLIELGDEYNRRRTSAAEHRDKNKALRIINKSSSITDEEVNAINARTNSTQVVGISADPSVPLANQIASLPEIPYNPQMYDTSDILFDIETVSNAQDAASGAIRTAKTATEAEIASSGQQSRTSEMTDVIEDWLSDIASYSAQLLLQNVPEAVIKKRFGQSSVWPELTKKELFEMVNVTIRAGSTSKPNRMRERDQWIQLLPEFKEAIQVIVQAKAAGNQQMVDITMNLLNETLRRFDEKLDVKTLLGMNDDGSSENQLQVMPPPIAPQVPAQQAPIPQEAQGDLNGY